MTVGNATVKYTGTLAKPQVEVSSSGVTVTALGGATISSVVVDPISSLNETNVAFVRGGQIWDWNYLTGTATQITSLAGNSSMNGGPSFGRNVVVFATGGSSPTLYACFYDGSGLVKVKTGTNSVVNRPCYANSLIAGYDAAGDLVVEGAGGGNATILVPHGSFDFDGQVAFLGSAQTVVYQNPLSGAEQPYQISFTGSSYPWTPGTAARVANVTNPTSGTGYDLQLAVNLAGTALAMNESGSTSSSTLYVWQLSTGSNVNITNPSQNYMDPSFSPDGTQIAFIAQDQGASSNDGSFGLYTALIDGENPTQVVSDPSGTGGPLTDTSSFAAWSAFPGSLTLVGSGGSFGSSVSGFLQAQVGDAMASFVGYTASPASSVVETPANTSSSSSSTLGSLVWTLAATSFTSISWNNSYGLPIPSNQTLGLPSTTTNIVVSFSGTTGQCQYVAPLAGSGAKTAGAAPLMTKTPTSYVFNGRFSGIYDAKGHNLAPSGASQLVLDQKTGSLVSFK